MNFYILGKIIYGKNEFSDWVVVIKESDRNLLETDKLFSIPALKVDLVKKTVSKPMTLSEFIKFSPYAEFDTEEEKIPYNSKVENILKNEQEKDKIIDK